MIAVLLALLMLLPACSEQTETDESESSAADESITETVPEETEYKPDLPDVTYEGEDFKVLYKWNTGNYYPVTDLVSDGITGEVVNDAVYNRNIELEDKFKIKIAPNPHEEPTNFAKDDFMSGSKSYDFMMGQGFKVLPASLEGYFYDWNTLTYFNSDDPWWDSNAAEQISYANRLYAMAGDISCCPHNRARFIYFSKGVLQTYGLEAPYDLVREGRWTIDEMSDLAVQVSTDLNGDGVYNEEDCLGILTEGYMHYLTGCGVKQISKDENDIPYVDCINEYTLTAMEKIKEMHELPNATCSYNQAGSGKNIGDFGHKWDYVRGTYYVNNHFLFTQNGAGVASQFIEMDPGYGILPNPKLDANQESYWHMAEGEACLMALPADADNIAKTDAIITYWAYSSDEVIDAFYEITLKHKRFDSPDDAEMLDIIRSSMRYELGVLLDFGIQAVLNESFDNGNLMSTYQKNSKRIEKMIESSFKQFLEE